MDKVKEILLTLLQGIVSYPDELKIVEKIENDEKGEATVFVVTPHKEDIGTCIGVKGSNAQALRRVIGLYAMKTIDKRVYVKIETTDGKGSRFDFE